ncbi:MULTISPECIES: hypothetical protein [Pseudomonadati]|uniref:Secreted protein n=1 Tax=Shewanella aestuarii TaxID=1028752 RepID=A0ABT0L064_9GAMM|nr:hypothetical protein [Shewanella aestuarii]MCL1117118.1 hypothetical protein [Shewanella aestuarii]GGN73709.1 hypothetical protein GCM10009193_11930 [Shewanella aestuarii]
MKKTLTVHVSQIKVVVATILIIFAAAANPADYIVEITPQNEDTCATDVYVVGDNGCENNQCGSDAACLCAKQKDNINFMLTHFEEKMFKLKFSNDSPLAKNCGKNFKKGSENCKVKDEVLPGDSYDYEVVMEGCGAGTDPKIIISN